MIDVFLKVGLIRKARIVFVMLSVFMAFAMNSHILKIVLAVYVSPVFAKAIDAPSPVEVPLIPQGQMPAKLDNSGLQNGELGPKNIDYVKAFVGPLDGGWVKPKQYSFNGVTEDSSSIEATSTPFAPKSKPMGNEPRKTETGSTKEPQVGLSEIDTEKVHPSFWLLIAAIVISLLCHDNTNYSMKHNVEFSRRCRRSAATRG